MIASRLRTDCADIEDVLAMSALVLAEHGGLVAKARRSLATPRPVEVATLTAGLDELRRQMRVQHQQRAELMTARREQKANAHKLRESRMHLQVVRHSLGFRPDEPVLSDA